jgi:hypothetical protein
MKVAQQLIGSVRMDTPAARVLTHEDVRHLAKDTLTHARTCECEGCQRFNKAMSSTKDTPAPSVSQKLEQSFKSLVHDGGARKPASGTIAHDEAGHGKAPKKRKRVSEALADSLLSKLR